MDLKKEKSICFSCYSGSIALMLQQKKFSITEEELLSSHQLLTLYCHSESDGIFSDIIKIVDESLKELGIELEQVKINSVLELGRALECSYLLVHIDCKKLEYSPLFVNATTMQRMHYIVAEELQGKNLFINDCYIPEVPAIACRGKIEVKEEWFKQIEFFRILYNTTIIQKSHETAHKRLKDILLTFESAAQGVVFQQFISNLCVLKTDNLSEVQKKKYLYEASTVLSVGGVIATRKILYILMERSGIFPVELMKEAKKIESKYNTLRLLLLKGYVHYSESGVDNIIQKIREIEKFESNVYRQACKFL